MKKKFIRDRSIRENSRSKDTKVQKKTQKSKNSSRSKPSKLTETNIYLKKNLDDHMNQRSKSPRTMVTFKKSPNLKTVKSGKDLLKNTLYKL